MVERHATAETSAAVVASLPRIGQLFPSLPRLVMTGFVVDEQVAISVSRFSQLCYATRAPRGGTPPLTAGPRRTLSKRRSW
jgi:hypothetical protein